MNLKDFRKGQDENFLFKWFDRKTAIGVKADAKTLVLCAKGICKEYKVEELRGHNASISSTHLYGKVGVGDAIGSAIRDSLNSGLFVRVKDINNPSWRITIKDEGMQAKWDEIMLQFYEERL